MNPIKMPHHQFNEVIDFLDDLMRQMKWTVRGSLAMSVQWENLRTIKHTPNGEYDYYDFRIYYPCPEEKHELDGASMFLFLQHASKIMDFDPDLIGVKIDPDSRKVAKFFPIDPS